jgi:predicted AlkP superfamily phosphohydrolase/phosphomutase
MNTFVGKVMERVHPDDLFMVLSDHGFHSFRIGFNLPTWLIRNGYLAVEGQPDAATATKEGSSYLSGYDWAHTRAYSIGLGGIFLNLNGREAMGTVSSEDAPALLDEIEKKLLELTYPPTGEKVLHAVYTRDVFQGESADRAPDLQLGYAEGFQTSRAGVASRAPKELFTPNVDKWSGEHAASAADDIPGIFFANRPLPGATKPSILDLGATALAYLNLQVPPDYQGHSLLTAH